MSEHFTFNLRLTYPDLGEDVNTWNVDVENNYRKIDGMRPLNGFFVKTLENPSTSLNVSVGGGNYVKADGTLATVSSSTTVALTPSVTNWIWIAENGTITAGTVFPTTGNIILLAQATVLATTIFSISDLRVTLGASGGHRTWGVGTPTIAAGAGAGTGPTVSLASGKSDQAGLITVLTGSSPTASAVVATVTFGQTFAAAPRSVILTSANAAAAGLSTTGLVWPDSAGVSTTAFTLNAGTTALAATTTYKWFYTVVG